MTDLGKLLLGFGLLLVAVGVILLLLGSLSGHAAWIGRLPGDIYIERGNWTFYFPLATSLLLSVVLTVLFSLFSFFNRQ
jgi:predicted phosphohydrolase